jgi:bifunctional non-homologous end joining protein LigD
LSPLDLNRISSRKHKLQPGIRFGGYTLPEGSRSHFGSLLVGYHSPDGLVFAGRVGTGFSEKLLTSSQLQEIRQTTCPFINLPEKNQRQMGLGITPAMDETLPLA